MKAMTALLLLIPASFWTTTALADCQCRANGHVFHHGETACLHLPSGAQLAQCGMVLNNSAWIKLQDGCPVASEGSDVVAAPMTMAPRPVATAWNQRRS